MSDKTVETWSTKRSMKKLRTVTWGTFGKSQATVLLTRDEGHGGRKSKIEEEGESD